MSFLSGQRSLFCPSRACKILPRSRVSRTGYRVKRENCNCLRYQVPLSCYHLAPFTFICTDKIPTGCLKLLFSSLWVCIYIYFCFVLRQPGELLDGKQPAHQDKVFCLLRGLFIVFLLRSHFLDLPEQRQRTNTLLRLTVGGNRRFGLKYWCFQAGLLRVFFLSSNF